MGTGCQKRRADRSGKGTGGQPFGEKKPLSLVVDEGRVDRDQPAVRGEVLVDYWAANAGRVIVLDRDSEPDVRGPRRDAEHREEPVGASPRRPLVVEALVVVVAASHLCPRLRRHQHRRALLDRHVVDVADVEPHPDLADDHDPARD